MESAPAATVADGIGAAVGVPRSGRDSFPRRKLLGILSGSWVAQSLYALADLGVPELLAAGPRSADDLALECGADPRALRRMLRALTLMGLFRQTADGAFGLTPVTELLRPDVPGSLHLTALMYGEEVFRSFAEIGYTVRSGKPAFEKVHGTSFYAYLEENPRAARTFHAAMGGAGVPAALAACDLTGMATLVDVGGGNGSLLAEALAGYPGMRGVLLELADGIRQAEAALAEAGVADRVELVEGSFFGEVPAGGDVYVLARVLHNWADEHAAQILHRVREAMRPDSRLIVFEEFLPDTATGTGLTGAGLVDLLMLVTLEGHDRTRAEYHALLTDAGLRVVPEVDAASGPGAIEAVPR